MAYRRTAEVASRLQATREQILVAAQRRLAHRGWAGVTIAHVAADAGVAVGTVYRHVADKDALCAEVFDRAARRELDAVRAAAHGTDDPVAGCEAALRTFATRALRSPRLAYALLAEPASTAVESRRLAFRRAHRRVFAELVAHGVSTGALGATDPPTVAAALVGAMGEGLIGPLAPARTAGAGHERVVGELIACCLRALPHDTASPDATPPCPVLPAPSPGASA